MADNGRVMCIITSDGSGYFYDIAGATIAAITDQIFLDFGTTTSVCYKDNNFIYTTDDEFYVGSDVNTNDGKSFDALDVEDAEVSSDQIVRCMNIKN